LFSKLQTSHGGYGHSAKTLCVSVYREDWKKNVKNRPVTENDTGHKNDFATVIPKTSRRKRKMKSQNYGEEYHDGRQRARYSVVSRGKCAVYARCGYVRRGYCREASAAEFSPSCTGGAASRRVA